MNDPFIERAFRWFFFALAIAWSVWLVSETFALLVGVVEWVKS